MTTLEKIVSRVIADKEKLLSERVHSIYWCTLEAVSPISRASGKWAKTRVPMIPRIMANCGEKLMSGKWD